ncbi:hypothetical protein [Nonomuraea turcica]|uniref:hypothetical protein n=1 Tax=Nonomuraea sp. G32 TaxID=3067274 RepID=UPI00273AC34F|nr:hypothetical protein [Nonomuraea sp. G32]MDP4505079.1 hypothetical protein [Nonomuraea sp. G32]
MTNSRILPILALGLVALAASPATASAVTQDRPAPGVGRQIAEVRKATVRFHSVEAARKAGYRPAGACTHNPDGTGAMGYHYAHPRLSADPAIDLRRPELLLYERRDGRLRLIGVEYYRTDADQDPGTDTDRPHLFGRAFDGPMAGHEPGQPVHYDLHAWVWKRNPAGTFAQWNRRVSCP